MPLNISLILVSLLSLFQMQHPTGEYCEVKNKNQLIDSN